MKERVSYFDSHEDFESWVSKDTVRALIHRFDPSSVSSQAFGGFTCEALDVVSCLGLILAGICWFFGDVWFALAFGIVTTLLQLILFRIRSRSATFKKLVNKVATHPAEICEEFRDLCEHYQSLCEIVQPDPAVLQQMEECRLLLVETFKKAVIAANVERDFYPVPEDTEAIRLLVAERMSHARTVLQTATLEEQKAHEELRLSVGQ